MLHKPRSPFTETESGYRRAKVWENIQRSPPQGGPLKTSESSFPSEPDEGHGKAVWAYLDCVQMQPGLELGDTVEGRPVGR